MRNFDINFTQALEEYRPMMIWDWNDSLDKNELIHQLSELKVKGFSGVIVEAGFGLRDRVMERKMV